MKVWLLYKHPGLRLLLVIMLMAMTFMGVSIGLWWPQHQTHEELVKRQEIAINRLRETQQLIALTDTYQQAQALLSIEKSKLENSLSQAELTEQLYKMAAEHKIKILSEANELGKPLNGYQAFYQELILQGSYGDIRRYLLALKTIDVMANVRSLHMSKQSNNRLIKANLSLLTYRQ